MVDESRRHRLRRSRLYLPGNSPRLIQVTDVFAPDCFILDLEDAVTPSEKDAARLLVRNALMKLDFKSAERVVRINPLTTPFGMDDLKIFSKEAYPDAVILPKAEKAEDVKALHHLLEEIEKKEGISEPILIMPLIETPLGVQRAYEIATASERVCALTFGAEDYTAAIGGKRTREGEELLFARSCIVQAAKAAEVQALDTIYPDIDDLDGLFRESKKAAELGFDGKGAIHPKQIESIHKAFMPSSEEVEWAKRVIDAIEEAKVKGSGVASVGRKMIDRPVELKARSILKRGGFSPAH